MNLAEYISNLNNIYNEYGPDLQVIFAIDDEGNDFKPINFEPTIGIYDDGEFEPDDSVPLLHKKEVINAICVN